MTALLMRSFARFMWRAKFSSLSVLLGIVLGVASVTGVHLLGVQVNSSLDDLRPPHLESATHVATRAELTVAGYAELRRSWRNGELAGVRNMVPMLEGTLADGTRVVATDWLAGFELPTTQREGEPTRFALDGAIAYRVPGARVGETLRLAGQDIAITAIAEEGPLTNAAPALFVDLSYGMTLLGETSTLQAVLIRTEDRNLRLIEALEWVMPGLSAGLPDVELNLPPPWQVHDVDSEVAGFGLARAVLFNVGALGTLSLLVALLLMYQTCVIWLRRQHEILQRLFEIGVAKRSLLIGFLCALLGLATLAVVLGLLLGRLLAALLLSGATGTETLELNLDAVLVAKATICGLGVALVGGAVAWAREWSSHVPSARAAVGLLFALLVSATAMVQFTSGLVGAFTAILLAAAAFALASLPVLLWGRRATASVGGWIRLRLGLRETTWFAGDLSIAVAALALALGVSVGVSLMVDSFRLAFTDMLDQRLQAQIYVDAEQAEDLVVLADALNSEQIVSRISLYGDSTLRLQGQPISFGYTEFDEREALRYGYPAALQPMQVLASERLLDALGIGVGDAIEAPHGRLEVVGSFPGFGDQGYRLLGSTATAERLNIPALFDEMSIYTTQPDQLLATLALAHPELSFENQQAIKTTAITVFDRTFLITDALTTLAVLIAAVALFNAISGLRLNQKATSELLNVLGWTRWERLIVDGVRAMTVGAFAILLAVPLGLWLGWVLCTEVNPRAFGWHIDLVLSVTAILGPLAAGAVAVMGAGLLGVPGESQERLA